MKTYIIKSIARSLLAAFLFAALAPIAKAESTPQLYTLVKTLKEAEAIKPGEKIAFQCGKCGAITTMIADADRSYLKEWTCKGCGATYKTISVPAGNGGTVEAYVHDDGHGHQAKLYRLKE